MNANMVLTNNRNEILDLVDTGFCPIECSIDGQSLVDELEMDHHCQLSHLESVAVRAYRDHFGARANDPRFVICGAADADACFAAAALAGLLPHPARQVAETLPLPIQNMLRHDWTDLAETIGRVDVSPIGLNIPLLPGGQLLLTWNALTSNSRDSLGFQLGVGLWRNLLEGNPKQLDPFLQAAGTAEAQRIQASLADLEERGSVIDNVLVIKASRVFGFPEWYGRLEEASADSAAGWKYPVVMAWAERGSNVTMGCPNQAVAEEIFGSGGLKNVFSDLQPSGWGGRESVGGSPRGAELTWEQVQQAAAVVGAAMRV